METNVLPKTHFKSFMVSFYKVAAFDTLEESSSLQRIAHYLIFDKKELCKSLVFALFGTDNEINLANEPSCSWRFSCEFIDCKIALYNDLLGIIAYGGKIHIDFINRVSTQ